MLYNPREEKITPTLPNSVGGPYILVSKTENAFRNRIKYLGTGTSVMSNITRNKGLFRPNM